MPSIGCGGSLLPTTNNSQLGDDNHPWAQIYAINPNILSSDIKKKYDVLTLDDRYSTFFDLLRPVSYKMKSGTSGRRHVGLIANEVAASLQNASIDSMDFAGYCEWSDETGETSRGLRYEEFIVLCIQEIQHLKQRVVDLETINSRKE